MAYAQPSTRATGYQVTAANWNELVTNWRDLFGASGLLKHENGGIELDISAITTGGILSGASSGVMKIRTGFLDGSDRVKHEYGGIEADISGIAAGGTLVGTGTGSMGILAIGSALQALRANSGASALEWATLSTAVAVEQDDKAHTSTTLADSDNMQIAVSANSRGVVLVYAEITGHADSDIKININGPTDYSGSSLLLYGTAGADVFAVKTAATSGMFAHSALGAATGANHLLLVGGYQIASNAGNLTFQFANNSGSNTITLKEHSALVVLPA